MAGFFNSQSEAIEDLGVARIGHGVRAIEDMGLVEALAERGTVLEVCPGRNIALGLYPGWAAHPVERLRAEGVRVTLSTDDPTNALRVIDQIHGAGFGALKQDFPHRQGGILRGLYARPFASRSEAEAARRAMQGLGHSDAFIWAQK